MQLPSPSTAKISTFWLQGTQSQIQPSLQRLQDEAKTRRSSCLKTPSLMKRVLAEARFNFSLNMAEKCFPDTSLPLLYSLWTLPPSIKESLEGATSLSLQTVAEPHFKYSLDTRKACYYSPTLLRKEDLVSASHKKAIRYPYGTCHPRCSSPAALEHRLW